MFAAVQQDGWALQNVDPELKKDREIVLAAVKRNEKIGLDHVASVPERRRMYGWTFQRVRIPARSILRTIRYVKSRHVIF